MGTSGGEPRVLLNALKPMLGVIGDIRTPQEVMRVVGMMKDAEKLMSRCVYLNILKATCKQALLSDEKRNTLDKFLMTGGWGILNKWLHEFTKSENFPVLLELIDVLRILPITVELLKQGNTGKLIKQMTKLDNADVKKNAGSLIRQWKDMIRGAPDPKKPSKENDVAENGQEVATKRAREQDAKGPPEKKSKTKLSDSFGFMAALNAVPAAPIKKKRRNSDPKTTLPLDEILNRSSDKKQKVENDERVGGDVALQIDPDSSTSMQYISPAVEAANQALASEIDDNPIVDEGSLARKKNKKKRNITWATDDKLVQIEYYVVPDCERKRGHNESFSEARQHELMLEKQTLRSHRHHGEDNMIERIRWKRLIPVDNAGIPNFISGEKSLEKHIQADREKSVLAFIFLTKESLPDNPTEADFDADEHSNRAQVRMIPHDEDGTVFPVSKPVNNSATPASSSSRLSKDKDPSPNKPQTTNNNNSHIPNKKPANPREVVTSPAVHNIMNQLLRNNPPGSEPPPQKIPSLGTNVSSALLAVKGQNVPPPPPIGVRPDNNTNSGPPFNKQGDDIPSIMDSNINLRGRGPMGPRFRGGPPPNPSRGGFIPRGGSGAPPRWDGPVPEDWNYNNFNEGGGFNDNYRPGPNSRGGGNFGPPPHGGRNDGFNENFGNANHRGGFHRGGNNRNGNDRGRGGNNRNRDWNNEWNNDNGPPNDRREGDWNRGRGRGRGNNHRNNRDKGQWRKW